MKKIRTILALLVGAFIFTSCQSDSDSQLSDNSAELKTISLSYNGNTYHSSYYEAEDGCLIFTDKIVEKVYKEIQENPTLATLMKANGEIEYFESFDKLTSLYQPISLEEDNDTPSLRIIQGNSAAVEGVYGEVTFYTEPDCPTIPNMLTSQYAYQIRGEHYAPTLPSSFHKKFSSMWINVVRESGFTGKYDHCVTFFSETNYQGASCSFESSIGYYKRNLKNIPAITSTYDWDNQIASIRSWYKRSY